MSKRLRQLALLLPVLLLFTVQQAAAFSLPLPSFPPVLPKPGIQAPEKGPLPKELTSCDSLRCQVLRYVNYALTFVGLIAVIVFIYAGFLYLTSAGDAKKADEAKKAMTYAVIGILVILLSYVIVKAVIDIPTQARIGGSSSFPDPP